MMHVETFHSHCRYLVNKYSDINIIVKSKKIEANETKMPQKFNETIIKALEHFLDNISYFITVVVHIYGYK